MMGQGALSTYRITDDKQETLIGSSEYIPVCRKCYIKLNENNVECENGNHIKKQIEYEEEEDKPKQLNVRQLFGLS